jgi:hypothetical protein
MQAMGGVIIGGSVFYALTQTGKKEDKPKTTTVPSYLEHLVPTVGAKVAAIVGTDSLWGELCDRAAEFAPLARNEYANFVHAVAGVVGFKLSLKVNKTKLTLGTPRLFRAKLHAVIEEIRNMRAEIEEKSPSSLEDFDYIAADVQKLHDDEAYNNYQECSSY